VKVTSRIISIYLFTALFGCGISNMALFVRILVSECPWEKKLLMIAHIFLGVKAALLSKIQQFFQLSGTDGLIPERP